MGEQDSDQAKEPDDQNNGGSSGETPTEKPEPDEEDKEKAAEMMTAYQERPTLVLPGTGGAVSGTAVGNWLDDDGNPKYANDEDAPPPRPKQTTTRQTTTTSRNKPLRTRLSTKP